MPQSILSFGADAQMDMPFLYFFGPQLKASYRTALHSRETAEIFPHMKTSILCGNETCGFAIAAIWAAEDDEKANPGYKPVTYKVVEGANHFVRLLLYPVCLVS
jgi:hypothetical protein